MATSIKQTIYFCYICSNHVTLSFPEMHGIFHDKDRTTTCMADQKHKANHKYGLQDWEFEQRYTSFPGDLCVLDLSPADSQHQQDVNDSQDDTWDDVHSEIQSFDKIWIVSHGFGFVVTYRQNGKGNDIVEVIVNFDAGRWCVCGHKWN